MYKKFPIKEDLLLSAKNFFEPNKERVEKMVSMLQMMNKSLKAYLDKPLEDNDAHFTCGNALGNLTGALKDLIIAMNYYQTEIVAKAQSWDRYPCDFSDGEDRNESERKAYVKGYMDNKL